MFSKAHIVGSMKPRWPFNPAYMHTFGITERYFVIIEQPLSVSLWGVLHNQLANEPLSSSLHWYPKHETHIVLISREDGKEWKRFRTEPLFFLHIINCFEDGNRLTLDVCTYKDPKALDAMYIQAIETMQSNAEYAEWFRARPKRFELSLEAPRLSRVMPRLLVDLGCETPRIHYDLHNGRPYRYFYAISSDVDAENPGSIIKVDLKTGEILTWCDSDCYPSEPIFVPAPDAKSEDDGVLLSALVFGGARSHEVALLVLDARRMRETARAHFHTPSPAPKCLHGWYLPQRTVT